jgi:hypothetical protein
MQYFLEGSMSSPTLRNFQTDGGLGKITQEMHSHQHRNWMNRSFYQANPKAAQLLNMLFAANTSRAANRSEAAYTPSPAPEQIGTPNTTLPPLIT